MTTVGTTTTVRRLPAPTAVRACSTLARVDFADTYVAAVGDVSSRSAEEWARAVLEAAPLRRRSGLLSGWTALGLELDLGAPGTVLGWQVLRSAPDAVLLSAAGRFGLSGELLFERADGLLRFATFVQLDGAPARLAWARTERVHDSVVRSLLARVSPSLTAARGAARPARAPGRSPGRPARARS